MSLKKNVLVPLAIAGALAVGIGTGHATASTGAPVVVTDPTPAPTITFTPTPVKTVVTRIIVPCEVWADTSTPTLPKGAYTDRCLTPDGTIDYAK